MQGQRLAVFRGDELVEATRRLVVEHGPGEIELQVEGRRITVGSGDNGRFVKSKVNFPGRCAARVPAMSLLVAAKFVAAKTRSTLAFAELRQKGGWLYLSAAGTSYPLTKLE